MNSFNFILLREVAEDICKHYGKNIEELDEWEIEELVDQLIDEALYG